MCWKRGLAGLGLPALLFSWVGAAALCGEPALRLDGIPDRLSVPLPEGENKILTATVSGADAVIVWLAKDESARLRLFLTRVADGEYQINLGDPDVTAIAEAAAERQRLQVFAKLDDGTVISSLPVAFRLRREPAERTGCFIVFDPRDPKSRHVGPGDHWLDPDDVTRIEFRWDHAAARPSLRAEIGETSWPFEPADDKSVVRLEISKKIGELWREQGELKIVQDVQPGRATPIVLKARPQALHYSGNLASTIVHQRSSAELPGSRGYARIHLGDITAGHTVLSLRTAEEKRLIDATTVRRGETLTFQLGRESYNLSVSKLVNFAFGDDWAEIELSQMDSSEWEKIHRLLDHVAGAEVVFVRNGKKYSGRDAADHLKQKLARATSRVSTLEEFIEEIASRSSVSGEAYRVELPDQTTVDARTWLEREWSSLERQPSDDGDSK